LSASHACTLVIFQRAARVQPGDDVAPISALAAATEININRGESLSRLRVGPNAVRRHQFLRAGIMRRHSAHDGTHASVHDLIYRAHDVDGKVRDEFVIEK